MSLERNWEQGEALLTLGEGPALPIRDEGALVEALESLALLESGQALSLHRSSKDYIKATRRGDFWSADARRGGWWTLASFTAEVTSEYSERCVRESRAAGSIWRRLALIFASPRPEEQLSTAQVRTAFTEYLLGRKFTIPRSGA